MTYMVPLSGVQALKFGVVGVACLCSAYGLTKVLEAVNEVGKNAIAYLGNIANQPGNSALTFGSGICKKTVEVLHLLTLTVLALAAVILWALGTVLVMYAVVGPLL